MLSQSYSEVQYNTETIKEKTADKTIPQRLSAPKRTKRKMDAKSEEAYAVMSELKNKMRQRDDFDVYGEYVANTLRNLKNKSVLSYTKFEINNLLYRAETSDESQSAYSSSMSIPFTSSITVTTPYHTESDASSSSTPILSTSSTPLATPHYAESDASPSSPLILSTTSTPLATPLYQDYGE